MRGTRATFSGVLGFWGMNTFLKVVLVTIAVLVAIKLLPVTLAIGCGLAVALVVALALGLSAVAVLVVVAIGSAAMLAPVWIPLLVAVGIVALVKRSKGVTA